MGNPNDQDIMTAYGDEMTTGPVTSGTYGGPTTEGGTQPKPKKKDGKSKNQLITYAIIGGVVVFGGYQAVGSFMTPDAPPPKKPVPPQAKPQPLPAAPAPIEVPAQPVAEQPAAQTAQAQQAPAPAPVQAAPAPVQPASVQQQVAPQPQPIQAQPAPAPVVVPNVVEAKPVVPEIKQPLPDVKPSVPAAQTSSSSAALPSDAVKAILDKLDNLEQGMKTVNSMDSRLKDLEERLAKLEQRKSSSVKSDVVASEVVHEVRKPKRVVRDDEGDTPKKVVKKAKVKADKSDDGEILFSNSLKETAASEQVSSSSEFNLQAVAQGRAWAKSKDGATLTFTVGDVLPNGEKVIKIDADKSVVKTNRGVMRML